MTTHLAVVVDSGQRQRGPGELQGLKVEAGTGGSLAFDGGLIPRSLARRGRRAIKNTHGVEGETVENLNAAIMEA